MKKILIAVLLFSVFCLALPSQASSAVCLRCLFFGEGAGGTEGLPGGTDEVAIGTGAKQGSGQGWIAGMVANMANIHLGKDSGKYSGDVSTQPQNAAIPGHNVGIGQGTRLRLGLWITTSALCLVFIALYFVREGKHEKISARNNFNAAGLGPGSSVSGVRSVHR
jgi:hypothetical protein